MPTLSSHIVRRKLASVPDVEEALARQVLYGGDLVTNLLELSAVSEPLLVELLAENYGLNPAPAGALPGASAELTQLISAEVATRYSIFPLGLHAGRLELAVSEPLAAEIEQDLVFSLGLRIEQQVAPLVRIRQAVARDYLRPLDKRTARVIAGLDGKTDPHPSMAPSEPPVGGRGLGRLPRPLSVPPPQVASLERTTLRPNPERTTLRPSASVPPQGHISRPTSPGFSSPVPRLSDVVHSRPTLASPPRRLGPYTASMTEHDLVSAESRDQVLFSFFDFAAQYFEYTALFLVHGDLAEGRLARGPGANTEKVCRLGVPLDLESALSSATRSGSFKLTALASIGLDATLAQDLGRSTGRRVLILPVTVKSRCVLLLYGDHGHSHVKLADVGDVIALGGLTGSSLERLIVNKKAHSRYPGAPPAFSRPSLPRPGSQFARPEKGERAKALMSALADAVDPVAPNAFLKRERNPTLPGLSGPPVHVLPRAVDVTPPMGTPAVASLRPGPPPRARRNLDFSETLPIPLTQSRPPVAPTPQPAESGWDIAGAELAPSAQHLEVVPEVDSERIVPAPGSRSVSVAAQQPRPARKSNSHNLPTVIVDLASNCQALVAELILGNVEAGNQLIQVGGPAASALAARLPGPLHMEYLNALGEIHARASQCGPLLRTLARLGAQAAPFVALRTLDSEANVRAWATHLLAEMPCEEAARAIAKRLFDDDAEVRKVAIFAGRSMQSNVPARACFLDQLASYCASPESPDAIRLASIQALEALRDPQGTPTLMALLEGQAEPISQAARRALVTLIREDFGPDAEPWRRWWEQNRHRHRIEWLIDALMNESSALRSAASEELKSLTKEYFGYYEDLPKKERSRAQERYREWWEHRGKARFD